ncbi:unnamed protein product [Orchesella dallaii]|uniref:Helicase C-terminal domain-containing protein n=1 Tax=Orchesella dallaii TaxID=48710 RepID=A0ABP1QLZ1_9HEXA
MASNMGEEPEINFTQCKCLEDLENLTVAQLKHYTVGTTRNDEIRTLMELLSALDYKQAVIFTNSSIRSEVLSDVLNHYGYATGFMHARMPRPLRCLTYAQFRRMESDANIMVMSGFGHVMESEYVDVVINFDMVESPLAYMHRTSSRQVRKGMVVTMLRSKEEVEILNQVEKMQHIKLHNLPGAVYARMHNRNTPSPLPTDADARESF